MFTELLVYIDCIFAKGKQLVWKHYWSKVVNLKKQSHFSSRQIYTVKILNMFSELLKALTSLTDYLENLILKKIKVLAVLVAVVEVINNIFALKKN